MNLMKQILTINTSLYIPYNGFHKFAFFFGQQVNPFQTAALL